MFTSILCKAQIPDTKAVFVKLPTYTKRLEYYKVNGQSEKIQQLMQDVDSITKYVIDDFTDNFTFAPVYYFYDTSIDLIKDHQLAKVLMNADLTSIDPSKIETIGDKYLVVEYALSDHAATRGSYRLLVYYPNMERVDILLKMKGILDESNTYYSPKFKIGYRGEARILSKKLTNGSTGW